MKIFLKYFKKTDILVSGNVNNYIRLVVSITKVFSFYVKKVVISVKKPLSDYGFMSFSSGDSSGGMNFTAPI